MKAELYEHVLLADGREGVVVEIFPPTAEGRPEGYIIELPEDDPDVLVFAAPLDVVQTLRKEKYAAGLTA